MNRFFAYAKINLFLKITGIRGDYHELASRFWRVETLYDTLAWSEGHRDFEVRGNFSCPMHSNSIFRVYQAILPYLNSTQKSELQKLGIVVEKRIPEGAGLGGGSSDAATFLLMLKERFALTLSTEELARIGVSVGADIPFFVFGYKSANVRGIGEIVEYFDEIPTRLELFTPPIKIDTGVVYRYFREAIMRNMDLIEQVHEASRLLSLKGEEILRVSAPLALNDLYPATLACYPILEKYAVQGRFFSGSGSTFFVTKAEN